MPPAILYDGLRLFLAALSPTPRGVDRVDLGYARFLLENWPADCLGVLPTPWGIRLYDRDRARRLLATVEAAWRETQSAGADPAYGELRAWLTGTPLPARSGRTLPRTTGAARAVRLLRENGLHWGRPAIGDAPGNAVYLNVGQLGWAAPVATRWLRHRADIRSVYLLHDVIPLDRPDLVSGGARLSQDWMLRSVLRRADGLITTTRSASDTVQATLRRMGRPDVPAHALPLPVAGVFLQADPPDDELRGQPYFVVCGAIEPRKNHGLLLRVWQRLVQRVGPDAPRLVVAGTPAHRGDRILRQIGRHASHVTVVSGLASPSLRALMRSARGVLAPSLAEGFGLPLIEALAVGTPVVASDLPAHREAGGGLATYLDPADEAAWLDAIVDLTGNTAGTAAWRRQIGLYRPLTSAEYFRSAGAFLAGFG